MGTILVRYNPVLFLGIGRHIFQNTLSRNVEDWEYFFYLRPRRSYRAVSASVRPCATNVDRLVWKWQLVNDRIRQYNRKCRFVIELFGIGRWFLVKCEMKVVSAFTQKAIDTHWEWRELRQLEHVCRNPHFAGERDFPVRLTLPFTNHLTHWVSKSIHT